MILPGGEHLGTTLQRFSSKQLAVSRLRYKMKTTSALHGNEYASLVFIEGGHCSKQMGSSRLELAPNAGLYLPASCMQQDIFPKNTTFLSIDFKPPLISRLLDERLVGVEPLHLPPALTLQLRTQATEELAHTDTASALILEGLVMSTIGVCQRRITLPGAEIPKWLLRVKEMLHDQLRSDLSLEGLSRAVHIHPAHLTREFKRHFRSTPGEYLRRLRIAYVQDLLRTTKMSLAAIALDSGFCDQAHLSRVFRRYIGQTPSSFRRSCLK